MKGVITLVVLVLLCISLVVAVSTTPHGFHGNVYYSDGTLISKSLEITADLDGELETVVLSNGVYDLVVESESGGMINFYIEGLTEPIGSYDFDSFEITDLDFTTALINPNPGSGDDDDDDNGGGGGGGGSNPPILPNDDGIIVLSDSGEEEILTIGELNEIEERTGTGLGAVIGFVTSGKGIGLMIGLVVVVLAGVVFIIQRRK